MSEPFTTIFEAKVLGTEVAAQYHHHKGFIGIRAVSETGQVTKCLVDPERPVGFRFPQLSRTVVEGIIETGRTFKAALKPTAQPS